MGHTFSNLLVHVVFSTKSRSPMLRDNLRPRLYEYMVGVARGEFGSAVRIGGTADHIHALLAIGPDVSVSDAMWKWKSLSSRWVHTTFPDSAAFAWQTGYAAFSVSPSNKGKVTEYIDTQAAHHRGKTFEEEFVALLERHGIAHDLKYVFD
jgi:REP-associated tyrosine transposase